MKTTLIDDWAGLNRLEGVWNDLLGRSRANCIFLTWEWIQAWRAAAGERANPFVVVVQDTEGAVVGLAPFYLAGTKLARAIRYRTLRILGDEQSGSEYPDWILGRDCEGPAARAIAGALAGAAGRWDLIWLPRVAGWTGARERLLEACSSAGFFFRERARQFAALDLPGSYESFQKSLSRNARSMLQRRARQVFGEGAVFEQCRSEEQRLVFLEELFALNHRRWSAAGQPGTFVRKPLEARFYRVFTEAALRRGWLRLYAIRVGDRIKAVQAGYVYDGTFLQLQEGFDPEGPSGIGNVLRARVIEECIKEGLRHYDFLGEFTEHKRRWLAELKLGHDLLIGRRGLKNKIVFGVGLWPTGRYLRPVPVS